MGDHPGSVAEQMSSSDVCSGVEVDCGKLDQLLLSQPLPPAVLDPSCAESAVVPPASCYEFRRPACQFASYLKERSLEEEL